MVFESSSKYDRQLLTEFTVKGRQKRGSSCLETVPNSAIESYWKLLLLLTQLQVRKKRELQLGGDIGMAVS